MFCISHEQPQDSSQIEALLDRAFGPDRLKKTAYRLRDGVPPLAELCFVLHVDGAFKGALRFWPVLIAGATRALLLGPLAVAPEDRGKGYGVALMEHGIAEARRLGHRIVILVGDPGYYERFGFTRELTRALTLPGPVEEHRFLGLELTPGALAGLSGAIGPWRCLRAA